MKFGRDLERVAAFERGGAPDRPLPITSSSEVEVHARGLPCLRCGAPTEVADHIVEVHDAARLRVAVLRCRSCAAERRIYFALPGATLN